MKRSIKFLVGTAAIFSPLLVHAQNVPGTVQVIVQNAISVSEDTPLNFGTIQAKADTSGADVATMRVPADNSSRVITNGTTAMINEILPPNRGVFTITGAAPQATLNITLPGTITLTPSGNVNTETFDVTSFEATDQNNNVVTNTLSLDASGNATLYIGATLTTRAGGGTDYFSDSSVTFTGAYNIVISY